MLDAMKQDRSAYTFAAARTVLNLNTLDFLQRQRVECAILTSLPDAHELNLGIEEWEQFFARAASVCFQATAIDCPTVFFQTDRRYQGRTISKANLLMQTAWETDHRLLFHKIVLRNKVNAINLYRPSYSHLLAFGAPKLKCGRISADVIENGRMLWECGMGVRATQHALEFVKRFTHDVCDPFCGMGTVLAVANLLKMRALGIEIVKERAEQARRLTLGAIE